MYCGEKLSTVAERNPNHLPTQAMLAQIKQKIGVDNTKLRKAYSSVIIEKIDFASSMKDMEFRLLLAYYYRRLAMAFQTDLEELGMSDPADTGKSTLSEADSSWKIAMSREKEEFFLVAARMVPYKRVELVAQAFRCMPDRRLVIVGGGPCEAQVRAAADGAPNIELRGHVRQDELVRLMQGARACLHAAEEDFGIALVEAQACGTPLITFGRGGARDIVRPPPAANPTGVLFPAQTAASIMEAMAVFDAHRHMITPEACRRNAMRFTRERFRTAMLDLVARRLKSHAEAAAIAAVA